MKGTRQKKAAPALPCAPRKEDAVTPKDAAWLRSVVGSVRWELRRVTISVVSGGRTLVWGSGPTFQDAIAAARDADDAWRALLPSLPAEAAL